MLILCRARKAEAAKLQASTQSLAQLISTNVYLNSLPPSQFKNDAIRATQAAIISAIQGQGPSVSPNPSDAPVGQSAIEDDYICSVCHSAVTMQHTSTRTPCNHLFHHNCLAPWLTRHAANPTCPNCRMSLRSEFIDAVHQFGDNLEVPEEPEN